MTTTRYDKLATPDLHQMAEDLIAMHKELHRWRDRCHAWQLNDGTYVSGRDLLRYAFDDGSAQLWEACDILASDQHRHYELVATYEERRSGPLANMYPLDRRYFSVSQDGELH